MSIVTTQFATNGINLSSNILTFNLSSELTQAQKDNLNKQTTFAVGFNNIVLETVSDIGIEADNKTVSVSVDNVTSTIGAQNATVVYLFEFNDVITKRDTIRYTFTNSSILPNFQKVQSGIEFQAAPNFLPIDWNFMKVFGIVLPSSIADVVSSSKGLTIENRSSDSVTKFYVLDTSNTITANTDTVMLVYHKTQSFSNIVSNASANLYEKLATLVDKYILALGTTIGKDTTAEGIKSIVTQVTDSIIAETDPILYSKKDSEEFTKTFDVMFFVVKQLIFSRREKCTTGDVTGVCNYQLTTFQSPTANVSTGVVTGATCTSVSPYFCVPFMQELYTVNTLVSQNILTMTNQINNAMGKYSGSTKMSGDMITRAETIRLQNKSVAGIVRDVVSKSKRAYVRGLIVAMVALGVCVFNIALIFLTSGSVQQFVSQLMLLVYMVGFVIIVVVGTTVK